MKGKENVMNFMKKEYNIGDIVYPVRTEHLKYMKEYAKRIYNQNNIIKIKGVITDKVKFCHRNDPDGYFQYQYAIHWTDDSNLKDGYGIHSAWFFALEITDIKKYYDYKVAKIEA